MFSFQILFIGTVIQNVLKTGNYLVSNYLFREPKRSFFLTNSQHRVSGLGVIIL